MGMVNNFKRFLLRGNVMDLAVAVVIGATFWALMNSLVKDMITPLLGIPGGVDFSNLTFSINGSVFWYGAFMNAIIAFVMISAAVYFFIVVPMNALIARTRTAKSVDQTTKKCPYGLNEIPLAAKKCAHCTPDVPAK